MTDRELLEAAAKSAEMDVEWHCAPDEVNDSADYLARTEGMWLKGARSPDNNRYWNPLTHDGDALRLAVKLNIKITPYPIYEWPKHSVMADRMVISVDGKFGPQVIELYNDDPYAATRRAIVRAAAAIQSTKPSTETEQLKEGA